MKRHFITFVLLFSASLPLAATAETAWVDDTLYVPVRANAGNQYRIVHRGLKSGTPVEVLQWDSGADWVKIRTSKSEGWVEAHYMSREPTARLKLDKAVKAQEKAEKDYKEAKEKLDSITEERDTLATQTEKLESLLKDKDADFTRLEEISADPVRLEKNNKKLNEELSLLRTDLQKAKAENSLLKNDRTFHGWLLALVTVVGGMIIGWFFKGRSSRRTSSWV